MGEVVQRPDLNRLTTRSRSWLATANSRLGLFYPLYWRFSTLGMNLAQSFLNTAGGQEDTSSEKRRVPRDGWNCRIGKQSKETQQKSFVCLHESRVDGQFWGLTAIGSFSLKITPQELLNSFSRWFSYLQTFGSEQL